MKKIKSWVFFLGGICMITSIVNSIFVYYKTSYISNVDVYSLLVIALLVGILTFLDGIKLILNAYFKEQEVKEVFIDKNSSLEMLLATQELINALVKSKQEENENI